MSVYPPIHFDVESTVALWPATFCVCVQLNKFSVVFAEKEITENRSNLELQRF